jgi:hypothetical protein
VIGLYYYGDATMKQIGADIGVNESRVSQLHARAVQRLRKALAADFSSGDAAAALVLAFERKGAEPPKKMAKATLDQPAEAAVVLRYHKARVEQSRRPARPAAAARVTRSLRAPRAAGLRA